MPKANIFSIYRQNVTPALCRGARGVLGWSQAELAQRIGVHRQVINHFERGLSVPHALTMRVMSEVFETGGVRFITTSAGELGLVLAEPS